MNDRERALQVMDGPAYADPTLPEDVFVNIGGMYDALGVEQYRDGLPYCETCKDFLGVGHVLDKKHRGTPHKMVTL